MTRGGDAELRVKLRSRAKITRAPMWLVLAGLIVMQTYDTVAQVADDAARRVRRVVCFFQSLFVIFVASAIAIDLTPSPRLECHKESAQVMSPYPHPYGLPPAGTWTVCEWNPPKHSPTF